MDDSAVSGDMFSSMESELISNIQRPSLFSLSSEDSSDDDAYGKETLKHHSGTFKTSTPVQCDNSNVICDKVEGDNEDCAFKVPPKFPSLRSGKRYSLSILSEMSGVYNMNKSSSMHDVSSISSFYPLRRDSCLFSNETLQSNSIATTKSKDSGFQRSTSCTSLVTNASKKYDHVQSKVKQYIQTIKQKEALRKMQKQLESRAYNVATDNSPESVTTTSPESSPVSKRELLNKLKELEEELKEKDCVIEQLEKNQSELRLKYAAAENQIDDLRVRASVNDEPVTNYMSDEKVAELLTSSAQVYRKYGDGGMKHLVNGARHDDTPPFIRPMGRNNRELQPIKKFCSNSVKMNVDYPVLKSDGILKSASCKLIKDGQYELSKSASNVDKVSVRFLEHDVMDLPYEKNSFAKVQQWQRSLVNLHKRSDEFASCYDDHTLVYNDDVSYQAPDDSAEENRLKSRRYQKNKDADKKRYRRSYPVGCKCEKFKCRSKEDVREASAAHPSRGKLLRSVSFASCEDSMTSSIYDDGDSSSDSCSAFSPKHESYKVYKQRKLRERYGKYDRDCPPKWNEIKKAKSANSIHRENGAAGVVAPPRNKRLIDNVSTGYEYSCSERKHCSRPHNKTKYRKLDDSSKVASAGCNALVKCRSAHVCRPKSDYEESAFLPHSKSSDTCGRRCDEKASSHRLNKLECSCLTALENLKIQEHKALVKFAEHMRKHPPKTREMEAPRCPYKKRYSLQNRAVDYGE